MLKVNVHDAKTNFSKYLKKVARGETVVVCKRNVPVAELRPVSITPKKKRPIGLDKGKIKIPKEFFDPLPDDILAYFDGTMP